MANKKITTIGDYSLIHQSKSKTKGGCKECVFYSHEFDCLDKVSKLDLGSRCVDFDGIWKHNYEIGDVLTSRDGTHVVYLGEGKRKDLFKGILVKEGEISRNSLYVVSDWIMSSFKSFDY